MITNLHKLFQTYLAQTSKFPIALEIKESKDEFLIDNLGRKYIDLISGIAVSNLGHNNNYIIEAIKKQAESFTHTMVYGEYVLNSQVKLAEKLVELLPKSLNNVYFVNSGSEAIDASVKLAKRINGRPKIAVFKNAYHGNTYFATNLMYSNIHNVSFVKGINGIEYLDFNDLESLEILNEQFSCVIIEPIQAEAGVRVGDIIFLTKLREICSKYEIQLIFDENQTAFLRTGNFFAFENYSVIPDILVLGKALGGGMPLGAFISSKSNMELLTDYPVLGHITTFGGHPVSCAAGLAFINYIQENNIKSKIFFLEESINIFKSKLNKNIEVRGKGALFAVDYKCKQTNLNIILDAFGNGIIIDWFLFCDTSTRIAPPLTISPAIFNKCLEILNELIIKHYKNGN